MNKEIRFNIELFKIHNYSDWYKHFFAFLIRYFFCNDDFSWTITKKQFINKWIENWFNNRFLEEIYQKWKKDNEFIREIITKDKQKYITIKSLFDKTKQSNLLVYIQPEILIKITNINIFRSFCYVVVSSRSFRSETSFKRKDYFYKNPSRTITSIWKDFWNITKDVMSKRLTKSKEVFNDIFNITNRYTNYNYFWKKYLIQLSNLYSVDWIRYKTYRSKNYRSIIWEKKEFDKTFFYIKPKYVSNSNIVFWNSKNNSWFLPWDWYEMLWKEIKKEVFWKN